MNYTYYRRYRPRKKRTEFKSFFYFVIFLVVVALVLRACVSMVQNVLEEQRDDAILSIHKGEAEIQLWGQTAFDDAADAQILLTGDTVRTGEDSWVSLSFQNGTEVILDENTTVLFDDFLSEGDDDELIMELQEGRLWVDHLPKEKGQIELQLTTGHMDISSLSGEFFVTQDVTGEAIYAFDGKTTVDFVDRRAAEDVSIESIILDSGDMSVLGDAQLVALLARADIDLIDVFEFNDFEGNDFVLWSSGQIEFMEPEDEEDLEEEEEMDDLEEVTVVEEVEEEPEPEPEPEPIVEEEPEVESTALVIELLSSATVTTEETGIAIEGRVVSGTAQSVSVTWSGNGQPFNLSLFEPGDTSFRYVADESYANFSQGENTYTIVATGADGASNTLQVRIIKE